MTLLCAVKESPKVPAKITFSNISTLAGLHPYLLLFKIKFKIIENKAEKFLYIEPECAHQPCFVLLQY